MKLKPTHKVFSSFGNNAIRNNRVIQKSTVFRKENSTEWKRAYFRMLRNALSLSQFQWSKRCCACHTILRRCCHPCHREGDCRSKVSTKTNRWCSEGVGWQGLWDSFGRVGMTLYCNWRSLRRTWRIRKSIRWCKKREPVRRRDIYRCMGLCRQCRWNVLASMWFSSNDTCWGRFDHLLHRSDWMGHWSLGSPSGRKYSGAEHSGPPHSNAHSGNPHYHRNLQRHSKREFSQDVIYFLGGNHTGRGYPHWHLP